MRIVAVAVLLGGCATQDIATRAPIWHYERSNADGSEAEQVYVHRAAPDVLAVYKMRERCTRAALVTATIDRTGQASRLEAAALAPGATSTPYGTMRYNPATRAITANVTMDGAPVHAAVTAGETPWHLYDYDLATLSAMTQAMRDRRRDFSFGMALVWVDPATPKDFLRWIGRADARYVAREDHLGRRTLRYDVGGPAFGDAGGGPLWVDAREGTIVEARWGRPNHAEYRDFRLRLIDTSYGAANWTALLKRHFEGCPPR